MIYISSDSHFNHENIIKYCRPEYSSVDEMNWDIIKKWNEVVSPNDTAYILGDFAFKTGLKKEEARHIAYSLNGKKILILGNHDNLKQIHDFPFEKIEKNLNINIQGVDFLLSHYPYKHAMPEKDKLERPECFTPDNDLALLHGHTHDLFTISKKALCLCWDRWHKPVSEDEIMQVYNDTNGFTENLEKYNT